jgi:large subunit ribosomal protein L22
MKAVLKNYRQSPRKVRLVANLVRGKKAHESLSLLKFTPKRASETISKLIESAVANAVHGGGKKKDDLFVKSITVNQGFILKRLRPRARGQASRIRKRTAHIAVVLGEKK